MLRIVEQIIHQKVFELAHRINADFNKQLIFQFPLMRFKTDKFIRVNETVILVFSGVIQQLEQINQMSYNN